MVDPTQDQNDPVVSNPPPESVNSQVKSLRERVEHLEGLKPSSVVGTADAFTPPGNAYDGDGDGKQDEVGIDPDGDGIVNFKGKVRTFAGRRWADMGPFDKDSPPSQESLIEYEGSRFVFRVPQLMKWGAGLAVALAFIAGLYLGEVRMEEKQTSAKLNQAILVTPKYADLVPDGLKSRMARAVENDLGVTVEPVE